MTEKIRVYTLLTSKVSVFTIVTLMVGVYTAMTVEVSVNTVLNTVFYINPTDTIYTLLITEASVYLLGGKKVKLCGLNLACPKGPS